MNLPPPSRVSTPCSNVRKNNLRTVGPSNFPSCRLRGIARLKLLLLALCCPFVAMAQHTTNKGLFQVGAKWHRGFIIRHSRELIDVSRARPFGLELNAHWLLNGEKHVRQNGLIAKRGFAVYWTHFDNPAVLGQSVAVVPYVEPLILPWRRLYGSFQLGLGAAYVSKVYDESTNPTNLFFSLPLNFWVLLNTHVYFKINKRWQSSCGFNYNHISNGGMKNPNKGMNFQIGRASCRERV